MITVEQIADEIGRAKMAVALGVGVTAISNAVVSKKFPPSWYVVMQALCSEAGLECPPSLFGMRSALLERAS